MSTSRKLNSILSTTALAMMTAAGVLVMPQGAYAIDDLTTPLGENVVGGSASFDRPNAGQLNINQHTDRVVINWDSFNIGQNATTQFYQPGSNSLAVNRVTGKNDDPTQILGSLKANGRVMVLDRNGVFFGANSRMDVGGIIASTGDVDTASVMSGAGQLQFTGFGDGSIVNNGTISAADAGLVAFVGKNVANNGVINARLGKVALAAGDSTATVDLYGDGLVEFALDDAKSKVVASNSGVINAEGGVVAMSANAAKDIVDNVINMDGVINVSSVTVKGGKIILSGGKSGKVTVSGKLNASGKNGGGKIDVKGQNIDVAETAEITSNAIGAGNGGNVDLIAQDHMDYRGSVVAKGGELGGNGGDSEISGFGSMGYSGNVDLTAAVGETGNLLLDPAFAVIHSGAINNPLGLGYLFSAQALANTMKTANTTVQATNFIDVGVGFGTYNTGNAFVDNILNFLVGAGNIDLSTWNNGGSGTTTYGLKLKANTVNFNKDVKMGTGALTVDATNVNLGSMLYAANGTTLLGDSQLIGTAAVTTVNVKSNAAKINQAIAFADDAAAPTTINVAKGTYIESVLVNKANVILKGAKNGLSGTNAARGTNETIIDPNSPGFLVTANNVTIDGFEVTGASDNGIHVENASNVTLRNNVIHNVEGDGVYAINADGLTVQSNKIYDIHSKGTDSGSGIQIVSTNTANIGGALVGQGNTIYDTGWDGVRGVNSKNLNVQNNDIDDVFRTGVYFGNVGNSNVLSNHVTQAGRYGVNVNAGGGVTVTGNDIDNTGLHGINLNVVGDTNLVSGNYVDNTVNGDGIHADTVTSLTITGNHIGTAVGGSINGDGVFGKKVNGVIVQGNEITGTKSLSADFGSGIQLTQTTGATIGGGLLGQSNKIYSTGWDGVRVTDSGGVVVENNDIDNVFRTGVYFGNTTGSTALGNQIDGAGRYGVNVNAGGSATVTNNDVDNTGLHGINFTNVGGVNLISGNYVDNTVNGDGIHAVNISNLTIVSNYIGTDGGNISGNGIFVDPSPSVVISANTVNSAGLNGIYSLNNDNALIIGNWVTNSGLNGILAEGGTNVTIGSDSKKTDRNRVENSGENGIEVDGVNGTVRVLGNIVNNSGIDGVQVHDIGGTFVDFGDSEDSLIYALDYLEAFVEVAYNSIDDTNDDGIDVSGVYGDVYIHNNTITNVGSVIESIPEEDSPAARIAVKEIYLDFGGADGIHVQDIYGSGNSNEGGYIVRIQDNNVGQAPDGEVPSINGATDDGIEVINAHTIYVDGNDVYGSGDEGIVLRGYAEGFSEFPIEDEGDFDTRVFLKKVFQPWEATVTNNVVKNSGDNGIEVSGFDNIYAAGNDVSNSASSGLYISGPNNGDVVVEDNEFTDNDIGAYFESGLIDLTGMSNTFNNGRVGLKFAPVSYGEGGVSYLELVDDDAPGVSPASQNPPDNFGGTIGKQIFNDQSEFFVELDNGAFFEPGTPTWLNGLNSTYTADGQTITPSDTAGVLTDAQYNFLENRFYHWVDLSSLGRFWFGGVPDAVEIDQQDIFNRFAPFASIGGQVNVVLLGLPRVGGANPGPAPFNPNAIEPAAGGDDDGTATASAEELNQIQTAAGDAAANNSSCWADASSAANAGTTTTFSFSSVIDQSTLLQDSNCGSQTQ